MKSKAPLALMEQLIMLAVFALAAAFCLQAFVHSDQLSKRSQARDEAMALCQSVAEQVRCVGGTPEQALAATAERMGVPYGAYAGEEAFTVHYDRDWRTSDEEDYVYVLWAQEETGDAPGLRRVRIHAGARDEEELFALSVAWQEVSGNG